MKKKNYYLFMIRWFFGWGK